MDEINVLKQDEEGHLYETNNTSVNDQKTEEDEDTHSIQFEFDETFDSSSSGQGAPGSSGDSHQLTPSENSDEEFLCDNNNRRSSILFKPLSTDVVVDSTSLPPRMTGELERSISCTTTTTNSNNNEDDNNNNSNRKPDSRFQNLSNCNYNKKLALAEIGRSHSVAQDTRSEKQRASMLEQLRHRRQLLRDSSFQSDSSHTSHCSSIECLLDSRKSDPETILTNLGFKSPKDEDILSRIPKRFLKPSQVRGINTDEFLQKQQLAKHLHDTSVLGYRGLIGNPDIAPSSIVAKIMERFQINDSSRLKAEYLLNNSNLNHLQKFQERPQSAPPTQTTFPHNNILSQHNTNIPESS